MSDESVLVQFDEPVVVGRQFGKSWEFDRGEDHLFSLPTRMVAPLEIGQELTELMMPKWLAIDRGFVPDDGDDAPHVEETQATLPITRYDLIQAVALHVLLSQRCENRTAIYESAKIAHLATKDDR